MNPEKSIKLSIQIPLFLLLNLVFYFLNLWTDQALLCLVIDVILFGKIVNDAMKLVPVRYKKSSERFVTLLFPILLLSIWEIFASTGKINPTWFPEPTKILASLWELITVPEKFSETTLLGRPWMIPERYEEQGLEGVWKLIEEGHVWATLFRVVFGFVIGLVPAVFCGFLMGMNKTIRLMFDSILSAIYVLPKIAIFPIVMLVFSDPFGDAPRIAVVALSVFFMMTIHTMGAVQNIEGIYILAGHNYGAHGLKLFFKVILPGSLPSIFSGMRVALGMALIVIIAVEFLRAEKGVGYLIYYNWEILAPEKMYAGLITVMLIGILTTLVLKLLQYLALPWKRHSLFK